MAKINLTEKTLPTIKASGSGKQENYFDTNQKGFGVYVTKTGRRYYFVKGVCMGRQVLFTMGECSGFKMVKDARTEATGLLQGMREGINPQQEKEKRKQDDDAQRLAVLEDKKKDITLMEVFRTMTEVRSGKLKPRTISTYKQLLDIYLTDWCDLPMRNITPDAVVTRFKSISEKGKVAANNTFRTLRLIWNFGNSYHEGIFGANPVNRLSNLKIWHTVTARDREVPSHKMKEWYDAIMKWESPATRDYLLLLLFTGMRRNEAAPLQWKDIDFAQQTFKVKDTKNGKPLLLPLPSFLLALLTYRHKHCYENEYVFPGTGKSGHIVEPKRAIEFIKAQTGIVFSCHDLRRTLTSLCMDLLIHPFIMDALINHVSTGKKDITRDYAIITVERMKQPAQMISDRTMELCAGIVTADDRKKKLALLDVTEQGIKIVSKDLETIKSKKQRRKKQKKSQGGKVISIQDHRQALAAA
ncbi:MAG: integrase family protein [Proteobacteria bacterium]|nr:integrase family protein [Pseudomonadota bacterium]